MIEQALLVGRKLPALAARLVEAVERLGVTTREIMFDAGAEPAACVRRLFGGGGCFGLCSIGVRAAGHRLSCYGGD